MKNIQDQQNLDGKKVLLRLDLNVPLKKGVIEDETRIDKILPILNFLLKKKSKNNNYFSYWKAKRQSKSRINYETSL